VLLSGKVLKNGGRQKGGGRGDSERTQRNKRLYEGKTVQRDGEKGKRKRNELNEEEKCTAPLCNTADLTGSERNVYSAHSHQVITAILSFKINFARF
jgi:hypothetical protein